MPSSIFGNQPMDRLGLAKSIMAGGPRAAFDAMVRTNPQFAAFARQMAGKTPEQAFRDYGLDFNQFRGFMR